MERTSRQQENRRMKAAVDAILCFNNCNIGDGVFESDSLNNFQLLLSTFIAVADLEGVLWVPWNPPFEGLPSYLLFAQT